MWSAKLVARAAPMPHRPLRHDLLDAMARGEVPKSAQRSAAAPQQQGPGEIQAQRVALEPASESATRECGTCTGGSKSEKKILESLGTESRSSDQC